MALLSGASLSVLRKNSDDVIQEVPIRTSQIKFGSEVHCTIRLKSELSEKLHCKIFVKNEKRHIRVYKQVVNIPSFVVYLDSQKHIDFSLKSPFVYCHPGRVKRENMKKGQNGGGGAGEEED